MVVRFGKEQKLCSTCEHWLGPRKLIDNAVNAEFSIYGTCELHNSQRIASEKAFLEHSIHKELK